MLDGAQDGDVVELGVGEYKSAIRIERRLVLAGRPGVVLTGTGSGNVITVTAPDVTIRGVTIRGSGRNLQTMDSGVFLEKTAERALVEDNRLEGNLFGIYVHGAKGSRVLRNTIEGLRDGRVSEAGNGVSLWNAPDVTIGENTFRYGRDGIFTISSRKDRFINNRFEHVRFAVHYMYTSDSEVSGNVSIGNHVGYAIMFSNRLVIRDNVSDRDRDHGMLLNSANYADIDGNRVTGDGSTTSRPRATTARTPSPACRLLKNRGKVSATGRRNASSSTTPTRTGFATTGLSAARSACISRPARKATKLPAMPSSATAIR